MIGEFQQMSPLEVGAQMGRGARKIEGGWGVRRPAGGEQPYAGTADELVADSGGNLLSRQ